MRFDLPMRIWMPTIETGTGAQVYGISLADGLRQRGHAVDLDLIPHHYQYLPWFAPTSPRPGTDVVLANSWNAAAFLCHRLPMVSVCHLVVHDPRLAAYKSFAQSAFHRFFVLPMERAAVRGAAVNVAVSRTVARQMHDHLGAEGVSVVDNGVDTLFFRPAENEISARAATRPFRLLFVGRPSLRKGYDIIARIVDRLGGEVSFTSVGAKPDPGLPCPPGRYLGHIDKDGVREAYRNADLLLFPSRMEGYGLAAAEAMACGVPVVACPDTAVDDLIPVGGGIVRAPDDIEGFVSDIRALIYDPDRHEAMRQLVFNHALEHHTERRWISGIEEILFSVVQGAPASELDSRN